MGSSTSRNEPESLTPETTQMPSPHAKRHDKQPMAEDDEDAANVPTKSMHPTTDDPAVIAEARRKGMSVEELLIEKAEGLEAYVRWVKATVHPLDQAIYIDAFHVGMSIEAYLASTGAQLSTPEQQRIADLARDLGFDSVADYEEAVRR